MPQGPATTAVGEWQQREPSPRRHSVDATGLLNSLSSPASNAAAARMLLARMLPRWPTLANMPGQPSETDHPEHTARISAGTQTQQSDFRKVRSEAIVHHPWGGRCGSVHGPTGRAFASEHHSHHGLGVRGGGVCRLLLLALTLGPNSSVASLPENLRRALLPMSAR